jgi:hypothetical protein
MCLSICTIMNYVLSWSQLSTLACMTYVHNKFDFEEPYEMVRGQWFDLCYGWVQGILWHVINPWCHRCYVNPSAKVKAQIFIVNYYSFKSQGYNIQMHHWKRFWDVYVGILGFINDAQILKMFFLYHKIIKQNLFIIELKQKGIKPYIMGDKSYPLFPWLIDVLPSF